MRKVQWDRRADGAFTARKASFLLQVCLPAGCPYIRFLVRTQRTGGVQALIGSGTAGNIEDGMRAAEKMADRFSGRD